MKQIIILAVATFFITNVNGQNTEAEANLKKQNTDTVQGWKTGGVVGVNLTQVSLTNWAQGGVNSLSVNGLASLYANLKRGNSTWDNSLE